MEYTSKRYEFRNKDADYASLGGKPAPVIGGYTADQRFYMSYVQLYRSLSRDGFMRHTINRGRTRTSTSPCFGAIRTSFAVICRIGASPRS